MTASNYDLTRMGEVTVFLGFELLSEDDRKRLVKVLRSRQAPDYTYESDEDRLVFPEADPTGALARTQTLIRGLCDELGIPDHVRWSLTAGRLTD